MRKILFSLFCATNLFAIDVQTLQSENSRELVHVESSLVSNSPQKTTIASCSEEEQAMLCLRKNLLSIYPELADEPALKVTSGLHWEQYALSLLYFQGLSPISQLNKYINNIFFISSIREQFLHVYDELPILTFILKNLSQRVEGLASSENPSNFGEAIKICFRICEIIDKREEVLRPWYNEAWEVLYEAKKHDDEKQISKANQEINRRWSLYWRWQGYYKEVYCRSLTSILYYYKKFPNKYAIDYLYESLKNSRDIIMGLAKNELDTITRFPTAEENQEISGLLKALNLENSITIVRFVDAQSFILGLYLPSDRKEYYLALVKTENTEENINEIVSLFLDGTIAFSNDEVKSLCETWIRKGAGQSRVYRDLLVCFLARMEAVDSIGARAWASRMPKEKISEFFTHKIETVKGQANSCSFYNHLQINIEENCIGSSSFAPQGDVELEKFMIFFHEIGHSVDFFTDTLNSLSNVDSLSELGAQFFTIKTFPENFESAYAVLKKTNDEEKKEFCTFIGKIFGRDFDNIKDAYDAYINNLNTPLAIARTAFSSIEELWQIMGLFKISGRSELYINKLSDFALSLEMGNPVRSTHLGKTQDPEEQNKVPRLFKALVKLDVYDALFRVHGSSLQEYVNVLLQKGITFDEDIPELLREYGISLETELSSEIANPTIVIEERL